MTFVYPAVFTPKEDGKGFAVYFPDLACCETEGGDLEDALDNASDAMYNWVVAELEDEECNFPHQSDEEDLELPEGAFVRNIMVRVKFLPDSD
ncbi:MAG TPA: type II toxin-antitoxin system HicB family antitoxin [Candidatus Limivivens merdigallinarum]|uniref:Type II toxin-antitoxin system HicB family antitoxin n=1 Tax=Candidatus Limivivens merdigallinarum TaxID=2840859 RepID=A0A9D0ZX53_9FIRM|nr:type II toxin-antitoxin system HicB family antitoxin [Candidatus Limivivens merdigallinarum]